MRPVLPIIGPESCRKLAKIIQTNLSPPPSDRGRGGDVQATPLSPHQHDGQHMRLLPRRA